MQSSKELNLQAVIGFSGQVIDGLVLHPDNEHLIYPLGSTIVVRHILTRTQTFLQGHDQKISCIAISKSGKYIASGQQTHMGFQAEIIVWDFENRSQIYRLRLHKVLIQSLDFSPNEKYLVSLGGQDDMMLVIWDLEQGKPVCGNPAGTDVTYKVKFYNNSDDRLITVSNYGVRIWQADYVAKKVKPSNINLGNLKRQITNVVIEPTDQFAYCTTKTGDIIEIGLERENYRRLGPVKKLFSQGVTTINLLPSGDLLIGAGDGTIAKIGVTNFMVKVEAKVLGGITSLALTEDGTHAFCGTTQSNIYWVDTDVIQPELRNTCHYTKINDVCFPYAYSEVFATCCQNEIRVWNAKSRQELLRIQVPNLECHAIKFQNDGKSIISGWSDGKIRAFLPQSGKLLYCINDAHNHGVTAINAVSDCSKLISGGMEGEVRIWKIGRQTQSLEFSLKEHRGRVRKSNEQAVSASSDGSCIVWDIKNFVRLTCLFESTMFKQVLYHPDESQLLTTGSDRKITYWDCFDGQAIRLLDGSEDGEINALDITQDGEFFVSGGEDHRIKLWSYDDGVILFQGQGHSGGITKVKVSPDQQSFVSVGSEGAIFIWATPEEVLTHKPEEELPEPAVP